MSSFKETRSRSAKFRHNAWITSVAGSLIIGATFIAAYVGIQRDPQPSHLPVAVASEQLATAAQRGLGGKVRVTEVVSLEDGVRLVRDGRAVAAVGLTSRSTLQVDYAGAKGLTESGAARALVRGLAAEAGLTVKERDVVPLVKYDSRGLSAFYVVFGVTLSSFVLAQGLTGAAGSVRLRHRLYAMGGFAVAIGVVAATIAGPLLGALTGPWFALTTSLSLLSAAVAFATKALGAWLGAAGFGVAVLALTTVGNAVSGSAIGYDLLPSWARAISPILPPGAAVRAINEFGYFDGSNAWSSLVVLAVWAVAGFGAVLLRSAAATARSTVAAGQPRRTSEAVS